MKRAIQLLLLCLVAGQLLAGYKPVQAAEGMAYREEREAVLRQARCQAPADEKLYTVWLEGAPLLGQIKTVNALPGEYILVALQFSAGTGYEWRLANDKLRFAEVICTEKLPFPDNSRSGGRMAAIFLLKVRWDAPTEEGINFILARPWENPDKVPPAAVAEVRCHYAPPSKGYTP